MTTVLVGIVTLPLLASLSAFLVGSQHPRRCGRMGAAAAGAGFFGAVLIGVHTAIRGPVSAALGTYDGIPVAQLQANRLSALLLVLVYGVSAVVQVFALRYLACDARSWWFTAGTGLLTTASAGLMTVGSLIGLALCWTIAGVALCLLMGIYWHLPTARDGVLRTAAAFAVGDLALWSAVGLIAISEHATSLFGLSGNGFEHSPTALTASVLIVVAALSRSAQIPFHRWLPATLAAPTPVSALLHAGVVNAGGVLLVRLSPIVSGSAVAMGLAFGAGALSMVYGSVVMVTKSDIKGSLVYSTMAQMGFMVLTCGLGLPAAAIFHLVGHGFYKATLFLSSGSAIATHRRKSGRPPTPALNRTRWASVQVIALVLPAAALCAAGGVVRVPNAEHGSASVLLVFAWATVAAALSGLLTGSPSARAAVVGASAMLVAAIAYVGLVRAVTGFLAPDLPRVTVPFASSVGIVAVAVILGALVLLRHAPTGGRAGRLQRMVYAKALAAGTVSATPRFQYLTTTGAHK